MMANHSKVAVVQALYAGNALWFSSAFYYFCFKQRGVMCHFSKRRHSSDPAIRASRYGDAWHRDALSWLGGLNTSLAALAILRIWAKTFPNSVFSSGTEEGEKALDRTSLVVLGIGNFSQAFLNFWIGLRTGRWIVGSGFDPITVFDVVFTILDFLAFYKSL